MQFVSALARSFSLVAALCLLASTSRAQNCSGIVSADVAQVSISTGGVQTISLSVAPEDVAAGWQVLGSFGASGTAPFVSSSGLQLDFDRYFLGMYAGGQAFVQGGTPNFVGGPFVMLSAAGNGQVQVVVPPGLPSSFIGRTLHHGMYSTNQTTLLPACGTATVSLLLVL